MSEQINKREITEEMRSSYLDYAMSVIVSRALPDSRDGLKPVHRRILYAMYEMGLRHNSRFTKSANIVGSVLGRYHPHGDSAVYDSMVRMAQHFSLRYPMVEGQGNFGSIDGDSAAAYRYTEARLTPLAEEMLQDIEKDTVNFNDNYDGTRKEPQVLPSVVPSLLLNGTMGIAVGMATNIPPHNLTEVADATIHLIDNPKSTTEDLLQYIKGPDFPTGGVIYDKKSMVETYSNGRGKVVIRGVAEIQEVKRSHRIVISEIPYQVNKADLIKKMADLVQNKKISGIKDIRDESDKDGLRIVIDLKSSTAPKRVLNQLYKHTYLQKAFHYNVIGLRDGIQPEIHSLKDIVEVYVEHRSEVIRRRTQHELDKTKQRVHILLGLSKALKHINAVIETIKKSDSKEDAHKKLMKKFELSDDQAKAILEMRLQTLAGLERKKIEDELKEKQKLIKELEGILKSKKKVLDLIKDDLEYLKDKYGDERRTKVIAGELKELKAEDLIPKEEAIITLTDGGYIKRMKPKVFKSQRRGGKGVIGFEVKEDDHLLEFLSANTHDNILFFTDKGRVFQTKVYEIPEGKRTSRGKAVHNFLEMPTNEKVRTIIAYSDDVAKKGNKNLVMATANGIVKKTELSEYENVRRTGIIAITLKDDDELEWVRLSSGKDDLFLVSSDGYAIRFKEAQARTMGRTAAGVKGIDLKKGASLSALEVIPKELDEKRVLIVMENGYGKRALMKHFKKQNRGGRGLKAANITKKTGPLVSARVINDEEEVIIISQQGQVIRTKIDSVRTMGRATQGVRIMNLKKGDAIAGIILL